MLDKYKALLSQSYEQYQSTQNREIQYTFSGITEKQNFYDCYDYLEECGYVETVACAVGFLVYKLTPYGISFVENNYTDPMPVPVSQGDNSIYVQGSNNTISNNYNRISTEIENSNIPDECKQLIEALLYDLGNPHTASEKKSDRIKSFLLDISSGALSEAATSGLTTLLTILFSKISF